MVQEDGSDLATQLWGAGRTVASSILAYPEGRAALASAHRAKRLTETGFRDALEDFETTHSELLLVGLDDPLAQHAGRLADELGLRGYDAVHLASALALGPDTAVVCWDAELSRAAADSGLAVAPAP